MPIMEIGNAHSSRIDGNVDALGKDVAHFEGVGFEYVKIPVDRVDGVIGAELNLRSTKKVEEALRKYHLKATVDCPGSLYLREGDFELRQRILRSSIEFIWHLGARILAYHGGSFGTFKKARQKRDNHHDLAERREVEALKNLSSFSPDRGVEICVENGISPIEELVRTVRKVDRENAGIAYDFGHGFLFYSLYRKQEDFLESIRKASRCLRHLHLKHNFERLTPDFVNDPLHDRYVDRLPFGEGDLHLPPGMGRIPYLRIVPLLREYGGIALIDICPRYRDFCQEALETIAELFEYHQDTVTGETESTSPREVVPVGA